MKNQKVISILFVVIIIIVILLIVFGGFFVYQYFAAKSSGNQSSGQNSLNDVSVNNFLGSWIWNSTDQSSSFGFDLTQGANNIIKGSYCASALSGDRSDCDPGNSESIKGTISNNILNVDFVDAYGGGTGKAIITYNQNNSLTWKIITPPHGEYYIPDTATLIKK